MRRWAIHSALIFTLAGCSSAHDASTGDVGSSTDTGAFDSAEADGDTGPGGDPKWWRLGATFTVASDGAVALESMALALSVEDESELSLCDESVGVQALQAAEKTPDPMVYTWWEVSPDALIGDCSRLDPLESTELLLGVGELHPEILAGLGSLGLTEEADALNGAYVSLNGGQTVYVYGVAGPGEAFEGVGIAATSAPLDAGDWEIRSMYSFVYGGR